MDQEVLSWSLLWVLPLFPFFSFLFCGDEGQAAVSLSVSNEPASALPWIPSLHSFWSLPPFPCRILSWLLSSQLPNANLYVVEHSHSNPA